LKYTALKTLKMTTEEKHTDTSFQNFDMIFKNETFCTAASFFLPLKNGNWERRKEQLYNANTHLGYSHKRLYRTDLLNFIRTVTVNDHLPLFTAWFDHHKCFTARKCS
jgi:hypothetical protein